MEQQHILDQKLIRAAYGLDRKAVQALLQGGANINARDTFGQTPLICAAIRAARDRAFVEYLVANGADVNAQDAVGWTALQIAAAGGKTEVLAFLVRQGVDLDRGNRWGRTALMSAIAQGHTESAKLLLDHGAGIEVRDHFNCTALEVAIETGQIAAADFLIERGAFYPQGSDAARRAVRYHADGRALIKAAERGERAEVEAWLDKGISPSFAADRATPLLAALTEEHEDVVQLLLARGASPDPVVSGGDSPLAIAVARGRLDLVKEFLRRHARLNVPDEFGNTPLRLAVARAVQNEAGLAMTRLLVEAGADVNVPNKVGITPRDVGADFVART